MTRRKICQHQRSWLWLFSAMIAAAEGCGSDQTVRDAGGRDMAKSKEGCLESGKPVCSCGYCPSIVWQPECYGSIWICVERSDICQPDSCDDLLASVDQLSDGYDLSVPSEGGMLGDAELGMAQDLPLADANGRSGDAQVSDGGVPDLQRG